LISALNTGITITMPKPHWSSIIFSDLILFIVFVVSSFVAYRFWPRQI
jgi:hypothetical protein